MSRRFRSTALLAAAGILLVMAGARAADVASFNWRGNDLYVRFSDSIPYKVDLAESDTSQLIIRFPGVTAGAQSGATLEGPHGSQAILTQSAPNELRLTVRRDGKLGYAAIWRPYSNTLVVHTFDWDRLEYPQQQYYKGLLALEQGLDAQATELLQVAGSTGEPRARSVLGTYYARKGDYAKAAPLLDKPVDADAYAALAAVQQHNGDNAGSTASRAEYEKMLADVAATPGRPIPRGDSPRHRPSQSVDADTSVVDDIGAGDFESNDDLRGRSSRKLLFLGGGIVLLLLLIGLVVWLTRRSSRRPSPPSYPDERRFGPPSAPDFDTQRRDTTPYGVQDSYSSSPYAPPIPRAEEATVVESRPHATQETAAAEPVVVERVETERITESDAAPHPAEPAIADAILVEPADAEIVRTETVAPEPIAHEQIVHEPIASEPVAPHPAASEPIAAEQHVEEPVAMETPVVESAPAEPVTGASTNIEAPSAEAAPEASSENRPSRSTPRQAADLRRRIEMMRTTNTPAPAPRTPTVRTSEPTVAEARRLQVSRDSIELRRRMEQHGR